MSGTIPLSLTQQFDEFGKPLKGGQLFLIQAGTVSTPQDGFQDPQLTIKMPYPITLDAAGRIPQFFLADGFIKVRLQDVSGVVQLAADAIQVIGPSGGGGGGTPVDPNALIQMGNFIFRYGIGALAGYVRLNNMTIGSAVSGATERANADTQALFQYLWITDLTLAVSGGRGVSAAADWAANKTIALPDWRGYVPGALDDMGNAPAGRLGAFFANPTVLGSAGGAPGFMLLPTNLPPYTPAGVIALASGNITTKVSKYNFGTNPAGPSPFIADSLGEAGTSGTINTIAMNAQAFTGTPAPGQISTPFGIISPRKLCTFYIKL